MLQSGIMRINQASSQFLTSGSYFLRGPEIVSVLLTIGLQLIQSLVISELLYEMANA